MTNDVTCKECKKVFEWLHPDGTCFLCHRIAADLDNLFWDMPRFKEACFGNFISASAQQTKIKDDVLAFCKGERGLNLVMLGKPGTGKTHLACAVMSYWIRHHRMVRYTKLLWITDSILSEGKSLRKVSRGLGKMDMLVIDEIDKTNRSDFEVDVVLPEIMDERYRNMKHTILIGNVDPGVLGKSTLDRVLEFGEPLHFNWESYRRGGSDG